MDAYVINTRLTPDDAYRFARGGAVNLPGPFSRDDQPLPMQLERPLDFAAVTDHAHSFGGVRLCTDPESPIYASDVCSRYRTPYRAGSNVGEMIARIESLRSEAVCGDDGMRCRDASRELWEDVQASAERWNDARPRCQFTTFVAYEYTATPEFTKIHRNVIFRNDRVPDRPITWYDEPTEVGLWKELERRCKSEIEGCDVLAIPHNPNLSNGRMFTIETKYDLAERAQMAALRGRMEPVVEVMQTKGESECARGMWKVLGTDEDCGFEKVRESDDAPDCRDGTGAGALRGEGCQSRLDFARYALIEGLLEADRVGVNPYAFGMIGSTDTHSGTPGAVEEWAIDLPRQIANGRYNPGGLAAVWAEENTRESLFQALRRREVYATSGPRMAVRFFGGWNLPNDLCDSQDAVSRAYESGVPMGGDLPKRPKNAPAPVFMVSALQDPGTKLHPGTPLQRMQIVKGWSDPDGTFHQRVVDVAGSRGGGSSAGMKSCGARSNGSRRQLCAVWRDPDFDANKRAVYYARVFEEPSCRLTEYLCEDADQAGREKPAICADAGVDRVAQERAWTSPIWYAP